MIHSPLPAGERIGRLRWLLSGWRLAVLLLGLGALPLLWPSLPPIVDLPNHMSRYRIGLAYDQSPAFRAWFDFHWALVGNLGVDLLVTGLAPLLGLEPATKLVVLAIPLLAIAGLLLIQREAYGRLHPLAALPCVFVYNYPFNFGFVNFTLSAALALLAFGGWIRLGRLDRRRLRALIFVPVGFTVWLCHACGWGMLGVMIFAWEAATHRREGKGIAQAAILATRDCLPLTTPLLPMLLWSRRLPPGTLGAFNPDPARKLVVFLMALRNGQPWGDTAGIALSLYLAFVALRQKAADFDVRLGAVGLAMLIVYLAMPSNIIGSSHADLRIAPYAALLLLLALRPRRDRDTRLVSAAALCFFAAEIVLHSVTYAGIARAQQRTLAALDHLPRGSTVFALTTANCSGDMAGHRMNHLGRMAVVRRDAFTNSTWPYPAEQTLVARPEMLRGHVDEDSQLLLPPSCLDGPQHTIDGALARLPRDRYRYLWMLDTPQARWPRRDWLRPVWHNASTILYAVAPAGATGR